MVRQNPRLRPQTLERPGQPVFPGLLVVAREVSHGRTTVVLTRDFAVGRDTVWRLLTAPSFLERWAPYTSDRDLSRVGRCILTMLAGADQPTDGLAEADTPSVVLVADSPVLLEHSWASDMLAWNISAIGAASRLVLRQTLADDTMASAVAAGWHLCLDVAASILEGRPVPPIRGMDAMEHGWPELNERYATALGVAQTRIG